MENREWTAEDDATLTDLYQAKTRREIAATLGRTLASVRSRCSRLHLNAKHSAGWTEDEIRQLTDFYRQSRGVALGLNAFALSVGRDTANVCRKARQLGLTDKNRKRVEVWKCRVRKYATVAERNAAAGERVKQYIQEHGHPRGALGMRHTTDAIARISAASQKWNATVTPEQRDVMSRKANVTKIEKYGNGNPSMSGNSQPFSRCKGGRRSDLGDRYFRSAWEANYARYLNFLLANKQIAGWEYEPKTFVFPGVTRGALTYTPDFLVTENNGDQAFHEVKGWMTTQSKTRLKRMEKHYPEVKIILIDEKPYRAIARVMAGLPHWE